MSTVCVKLYLEHVCNVRVSLVSPDNQLETDAILTAKSVVAIFIRHLLGIPSQNHILT